MPLVAERMNKLTEAAPMLGFLFVDEESFERVDELDDAGREVVRASYDALAGLDTWSTAAIEAALREELIEKRELKPRVAFGPVRIAVTGRKVSPPLFESLELLGRDRSLARLSAATELMEPVEYHLIQRVVGRWGVNGWWRPVVGRRRAGPDDADRRPGRP